MSKLYILHSEEQKKKLRCYTEMFYKLIGDNVPDKLDDFLKLKYNNKIGDGNPEIGWKMKIQYSK